MHRPRGGCLAVGGRAGGRSPSPCPAALQAAFGGCPLPLAPGLGSLIGTGGFGRSAGAGGF